MEDNSAINAKSRSLTNFLIEILIMSVSAFAVVITNGKTIMLPVFLSFLFLSIIKIRNAQVHFFYILFTRKNLLLFLMTFGLFFFLCYENIISRDHYYYNELSARNLLNGIEHTSWLTTIHTAYSEYHYWDLWFNSMVVRFFNLAGLHVNYYSIAEILFSIVLFSFLFVRIHFNATLAKRFIFCLCVLIISDLEWLSYFGFKIDFINVFEHPFKGGLLLLIMVRLIESLQVKKLAECFVYMTFFFFHSPLFHVYFFIFILLLVIVIFNKRVRNLASLSFNDPRFIVNVVVSGIVVILMYYINVWLLSSGGNKALTPISEYLKSFFFSPVYRFKWAVSMLVYHYWPYFLMIFLVFIIINSRLVRPLKQQHNFLSILVTLGGICVLLFNQIRDVEQVWFIMIGAYISLSFLFFFNKAPHFIKTNE